MSFFSKSPSRLQVVETLIQFSIGLSVLLAILLYIELAPKGSAPRDSLRLTYMMLYFGTGVYLCHHLRIAVPQLLWSINRLRYEGAPPEMERAMKNLNEECEFVLSMFLWTLMGLLTASGLAVLHRWFPLPGFVFLMIGLLWWVSLLALLVAIYWLPKSADNIFKHYRFLRRQAQTCSFYQPKPLSHLWKPSSPNAKEFTLMRPRDGFLLASRPWHLPRLCGGLIAFGGIGSGKSSCVMNGFLDHILSSVGSPKKLGGLMLDFKGEFAEAVRLACRKHGRSEDLVWLGPGHAHRWNPLDTKEPAHEVAARFAATMRALGQKDNNTTFFGDQAETLFENALQLLRLVNSIEVPPTLEQIYQLINNPDYLESRLEMLPPPSDNLRLADPIDRCHCYFGSEFPYLPDDCRQSIVATLNNMLHPLCTDSISAIVEGRSTFQLSEAASGSRVVYLQLPSSKSPKAGRAMGLLLKLAYYAEVRNKQLDQQNYSFFFADEFHEYFTSDGDALDTRFFAVSRQYDHINLVATQNINNLTMLGEKPEAVRSFLSNIKTKIFLQNSDKETNDYAKELFGQYVAELGGAQGAQAQLVPNVSASDFVRLQKPERGKSAFCESFILDESSAKVDIANRTARWPIHRM